MFVLIIGTQTKVRWSVLRAEGPKQKPNCSPFSEGGGDRWLRADFSARTYQGCSEEPLKIFNGGCLAQLPPREVVTPEVGVQCDAAGLHIKEVSQATDPLAGLRRRGGTSTRQSHG